MTPNMDEGIDLNGEVGDPEPVGDLLDYLRAHYEAVDAVTKRTLLDSLSLADAVVLTVRLAFPGKRLYPCKPDTSRDDPETRDRDPVVPRRRARIRRPLRPHPPTPRASRGFRENPVARQFVGVA